MVACLIILARLKSPHTANVYVDMRANPIDRVILNKATDTVTDHMSPSLRASCRGLQTGRRNLEMLRDRCLEALDTTAAPYVGDAQTLWLSDRLEMRPVELEDKDSGEVWRAKVLIWRNPDN
jgi:hypothetical protein